MHARVHAFVYARVYVTAALSLSDPSVLGTIICFLKIVVFSHDVSSGAPSSRDQILDPVVALTAVTVPSTDAMSSSGTLRGRTGGGGVGGGGDDRPRSRCTECGR